MTAQPVSESTDLPVFDLAAHPDIGEFVTAAGSGQRQPLAGFDADYTDIVDYIVRCTHRIWEEKAIGLIYTHYSHNAVLHTASGTVYGREAVVRATLQNQAMWGDLRAYADEVIWTGDDQQGFYTSHRVFDIGTHTGHSEFGPPTGRKISRWGMADCRIVNNRIVEEWVTHDGSAELRTMGLDPLTVARRSVLPPNPHTHGEVARQPAGQQAPEFYDVPRAQDDPQGFIRAVLLNLWNARLVNMVRAHYSPGHVALVPGGRKLYGPGDYENFVITFLACFPDLNLTIDHQCVLPGPQGHRVATRFTLQGTHEGHGPYGAPTGRRFTLLGISHHELRDGRVAREWTVFDEFVLLRQLYAHPGARADAQPPAIDVGV